MRTLLLLLFSLLAMFVGSRPAVGRDATEIQQQRLKLEALLREKLSSLLGATPHGDAYQRKLDLLHHPREGGLFFLPGARFLEQDEQDATLRQLCEYFAEAVVRQAAVALQADEAALSYQLLHEAAYFEARQQTASKLIAAANSSQRGTPSARLAQTKHPRLQWPARSYWRVTSDHYQVVTDRDEQAGIEIARRLEDLYSVWSQLFFDCWSSKDRLRAAWDKARALPRNSRLRHRVVLFSSREEYVKFLQPRQPRIAITLGFYDLDSRTCFFFADPDTSRSTQIHEATHQLFQERQKSSSLLGATGNFWIVEGVAMYMESMIRRGPYAAVGGFHANRLQFARYRRLQEGFYLPLSELVLRGRDQLQADENIRKLYSQSAGLTHFLMDDDAGRHRPGLIRYLRSVYQGRDRRNTLARFLESDLQQLDQQYARFLDVSDQDVAESGIQPDEITALCLGRTSVSDASLSKLPPQRELDWLDVSHTSVSDAGVLFADTSEVLRQVSLEHTQVTDRSLALMARHDTIDELDLSNTRVSDSGVRELARLPNLRRLWLNGTQITDRSLEVLVGVKSLTELACANTQVTAEGRARLTRARPELLVD